MYESKNKDGRKKVQKKEWMKIEANKWKEVNKQKTEKKKEWMNEWKSNILSER